MTYANDTAMPMTYEEEYGDYGKKILVTRTGLTKREHFAALMQITNEEDDFAVASVKVLMRVEDIPKDTIEAINFWDSYYAKRRLMKADALINELNK